MSSTAPPLYPPAGTKSQAQTALVLSILGLLCCGPLSPVAWVMANAELKAIREGRLPETTNTLATIAMVLGILGTIFFVFALMWVFFFGGLAMLAALVGR
jgi:uncharacterized membrane protein